MSYDSIGSAIHQNFTDSELIEIFEFARVAMTDADIFDGILGEMDLSEGYGVALRSKLQMFMGSSPVVVKDG